MNSGTPNVEDWIKKLIRQVRLTRKLVAEVAALAIALAGLISIILTIWPVR